MGIDVDEVPARTVLRAQSAARARQRKLGPSAPLVTSLCGALWLTACTLDTQPQVQGDATASSRAEPGCHGVDDRRRPRCGRGGPKPACPELSGHPGPAPRPLDRCLRATKRWRRLGTLGQRLTGGHQPAGAATLPRTWLRRARAGSAVTHRRTRRRRLACRHQPQAAGAAGSRSRGRCRWLAALGCRLRRCGRRQQRGWRERRAAAAAAETTAGNAGASAGAGGTDANWQCGRQQQRLARPCDRGERAEPARSAARAAGALARAAGSATGSDAAGASGSAGSGGSSRRSHQRRAPAALASAGSAADSGQGGGGASAGASGAAATSGAGAGSSDLTLSLVRLLSSVLQREPNSDSSDLLNALLNSNALEPALIGRVLALLDRSNACASEATTCASACKLLTSRCICADRRPVSGGAACAYTGAPTTTCG